LPVNYLLQRPDYFPQFVRIRFTDTKAQQSGNAVKRLYLFNSSLKCPEYPVNLGLTVHRFQAAHLFSLVLGNPPLDAGFVIIPNRFAYASVTPPVLLVQLNRYFLIYPSASSSARSSSG
jgi:hypothetical protein